MNKKSEGNRMWLLVTCGDAMKPGPLRDNHQNLSFYFFFFFEISIFLQTSRDWFRFSDCFPFYFKGFVVEIYSWICLCGRFYPDFCTEGCFSKPTSGVIWDISEIHRRTLWIHIWNSTGLLRVFGIVKGDLKDCFINRRGLETKHFEMTLPTTESQFDLFKDSFGFPSLFGDFSKDCYGFLWDYKTNCCAPQTFSLVTFELNSFHCQRYFLDSLWFLGILWRVKLPIPSLE